MLKFNHNDLSGWSVLRFDTDDNGHSTYDLFRAMYVEAGIMTTYEADLLMDANALADAREKDEYAWMPMTNGTLLRRLVDEKDDEHVNHVLETWPNDVKLFLLRKIEPDRWLMFRLKPATESPIKTRKRDYKLTFHADLYKTKRNLNWYLNSGAPLTKENKTDLETIRNTIDELLATSENNSIRKEPAQHA